MILNFLKQKHECCHTKVPVDVDEAYCPDCGELIKNKWYLMRCKCCGIKRHSHLEYKTMKPDDKYCPNCGSTEIYIQELDKITFIDVPYVVLEKKIIKQGSAETNQIWIEKDDSSITEQKLIGINL